MLTDITSVGTAWVISPPLAMTLLTVRIPVLNDARPMVRDGPSIRASGTVSTFCTWGGGSMAMWAVSTSRWNRADR